jgi:TRAP-type C4-dicarboxylate transport system substrate-binding protein
VIGVLILAACGGTASSGAEGPQVTWRDALFSPGPEASTAADEWLAKEIAKQTNGRFTIQLGYGEVYGKALEIPNVVKSGAAQMGQFCGRYYPSKFPYFSIVALPFFPPPSMEVQQKLDLEMFKQPVVVQQLESQWSSMALFANPFSATQLIGTKPINKVSDFSGQRISMDRNMGAPLKDQGAVLLSLTSPEFYTSLQSHLVDQIGSAPNAFLANKLYEVAKYMTNDLSMGYQLCWRNVNLAAFNALPKTYQQYLLADAVQAQKIGAAAIQEKDSQAITVMRQNGVQISSFPSSQRAILQANAQQYWTAWTTSMDQQGLQGQAFMTWYISEVKKLSGSASS